MHTSRQTVVTSVLALIAGINKNSTSVFASVDAYCAGNTTLFSFIVFAPAGYA